MIIIEEELIQLPKVKLCWGIKIQTGVVSTPKWSYFLMELLLLRVSFQEKKKLFELCKES